MIIDKKLSGILDQGVGHLVLFESEKEDEAFSASLETMQSLSDAVKVLSERAMKTRAAEGVVVVAAAQQAEEEKAQK